MYPGNDDISQRVHNKIEMIKTLSMSEMEAKKRRKEENTRFSVDLNIFLLLLLLSVVHHHHHGCIVHHKTIINHT